MIAIGIAGVVMTVFAIRDLRRRHADAADHDREQAVVIEKRIADGARQVRFGWVDRHAGPHSAWITVPAADYDADEPGHSQDVYVSRRDPEVAWLEVAGNGPPTAGDWIAIAAGVVFAAAGAAGATLALLKSSG